VRDTFVIARREFVERVRSKWFVVMTLLWPVLMVGMIVVPALLGGQGTDGAKVVVVDHTEEKLGETLAFQLGITLKWKVTQAPVDSDEVALRSKIRSNEINGFVIIPKDALDGGGIS